MKKIIEILGVITVLILFAMVIIQTACLFSGKQRKAEDRLTCEMLKNYFFYNQNASCEDE